MYYKYEKGEREPSVSNLTALADLFCVSIDELVGHTVRARENDTCTDSECKISTGCSETEDADADTYSIPQETEIYITMPIITKEFDINKAMETGNQIVIQCTLEVPITYWLGMAA